MQRLELLTFQAKDEILDHTLIRKFYNSGDISLKCTKYNDWMDKWSPDGHFYTHKYIKIH